MPKGLSESATCLDTQGAAIDTPVLKSFLCSANFSTFMSGIKVKQISYNIAHEMFLFQPLHYNVYCHHRLNRAAVYIALFIQFVYKLVHPEMSLVVPGLCHDGCFVKCCIMHNCFKWRTHLMIVMMMMIMSQVRRGGRISLDVGSQEQSCDARRISWKQCE